MTEERNGLPELPQGWVWTDLGEIIEPSKEKINPQEIERMPYVGLEHIERDTGRLLGFGYSEEVRSTKAVFQRGDLLYGKLRPYLNKVHIADFDGVCSTDILVFPKSSYVSNRYLLYRLLSGDFVRYANLNVSGVQHPRANFKTLSQFPVGLPPLPEQRRLVAKIEELFTQLGAGVAALERSRAQLRRYRQAVLKAAVEGELTREWREAHREELEPASVLLGRMLEERRAKWEAEQLEKMRAKGKIPKNDRWKQRYRAPTPPDTDDLPKLPHRWVWATVEQLASPEPRSIQSGPFGSNLLHSEFQDTGILAIGIDNVLEGRFSKGEQHRISAEKFEQLRRFAARPLDVLITVMATVGRCCVVPIDIETAIITKHVYRISVNQSFTNPYYVMYCLWGGREVRRQMFGNIRGQTRPGINGSILKRLAIPVPPVPEQECIISEIEQRLSVADEMEKAVEQSLKRAERLRQSILKRAFEGKLAPQDSSDEAASVLLERIKAEKARREGERKGGKRRSRKKKQSRQLELL